MIKYDGFYLIDYKNQPTKENWIGYDLGKFLLKLNRPIYFLINVEKKFICDIVLKNILRKFLEYDYIQRTLDI